MDYLNGIAASSSLDFYPGHDDETSSSVPVGKWDFLAALNQGEGRDLLDAYVGNRNNRTRNALAMHYGLCAQVVARRVYKTLTPDARRQLDVGDVEQTAMALLFQLVEKFDVSMGVPLSAFLTRRLRFAMIDEYRREGLMVRADRVEGERPVFVAIERGERVEDPARGGVERMIEREGRRVLLKRVPREYRLFVIYRYVRGMQSWQVGKKMNVTNECVGKVERECLEMLGRLLGVNIQHPTSNIQHPKAERPTRGAAKPAAMGVLPGELQREKEFRRWCLNRVPWAYRKLVAYRYLRGRDIDWTASRLGMCPDKARVLDRQARPMLVRVVEEYRNGSVAA